MSNLLKTTQQEEPPTVPLGHCHQQPRGSAQPALLLGSGATSPFFFFFFHHPEYFESSRAPQVGSGCTSQGESCISARMNERAAGCTLPGTEIGDLAPF